jgi:hypothetical protein
MPSILPSYLRAISPLRSGLKPGSASLPALSTTWEGARFDPGHVEQYRSLCHTQGIGDVDVPILYPFAWANPLYMEMLTRSDFPLFLVGSVHARNHIIQHRPLLTSEPFDVQLELCQGRRRPQGFEFDVTMELSVGGEVSWSTLSTFLARTSHIDGEDPGSPLASVVDKIPDGHQQKLGCFSVPSDTGRVFGRFSRDINPIHTSRLLARYLFGFERDLVHGMWALGTSLSILANVQDGAGSHSSLPVDPHLPNRIDCVFKGPCFMEHDVTVWRGADESSFELYSGSNPRPSVLGRWRNVDGGTNF